MLFYISILVKKLKNANAPLIMAIFLVMSGLASTWFWGGIKGASGQEFLKKTTFVSTAKGAGNASFPIGITAKIENETSRGTLMDITDLSFPKGSPHGYQMGLIKDPQIFFGQTSSTVSSR